MGDNVSTTVGWALYRGRRDLAFGNGFRRVWLVSVLKSCTLGEKISNRGYTAV